MHAIARPGPERPYRLWPFMLASLLLHGFVLQWFKPASSAPGRSNRPLIVEFSPLDRPDSGMTSTKTPPSAGTRYSAAARETDEAAAPTSDEKPVAPLDTSRLLESARGFAIEEEKRVIQEKNMHARTPAGMLEKELRQANPETRLANGMLKITTPAGTTYCLQPPPHFVQNTPAAALYNIPMTCP